MASFQKRLQKYMRDGNLRVAGLARKLDRPYTTVREWVLYGRMPGEVEQRRIERKLK